MRTSTRFWPLALLAVSPLLMAPGGLGARLAVRLRLIYHLGLRFAQGPQHDAISLSEA